MTRRIDSPDTEADLKLRKVLSANPKTSFVMRAGAGSGKTTSLIKALDFLLRTRGEAFRISNQQVVCITYTEVAMKEILEDVGDNPLLHVSTIHSFLWKIIRPFQRDVAKWVSDRIAQRIGELESERRDFAEKPRTRQTTIDKNLENIADYRGQLEQIKSVRTFSYGIGSSYPNGVLGHDDIIKMVPDLIISKPNLRTILAQKFPYFFIDESQDTTENVVTALKAVAADNVGDFSLGFFGDSMQKIYTTGAGIVAAEPGWLSIDKPDNFRCPQSVLNVINGIRAQGDDLVQERGKHTQVMGVMTPVKGTARIFVLPSDEERQANMQEVRRWLSTQNNDPLWELNTPEADVRILVIVHRMAALRLGFPNLYSAFNDGTSDKFKNGFKEGTAWPLAPLIEFVLPLVDAAKKGDASTVMDLVRQQSPALISDIFATNENPAQVLRTLNEAVGRLVETVDAPGSTIREIFDLIEKSHLVKLDRRLSRFLADGTTTTTTDDGLGEDSSSSTTAVLTAFFGCLGQELPGYQSYVTNESPYAVQQGIKGAEFERVIVIMDEEEGRHNQFSYEKLLNLKPLSKTDLTNIEQGKETVVQRTLRLFYVCCSRATKDLAVILYTSNPAGAAEKLRTSGYFPASEVLTLSDLRE